MNKLVITKWNNRIMTALLVDGKAVKLSFEEEKGQPILNNIYIGKVKNIVKNINAAFVDIGNGQMGYYSLEENKSHFHTTGKLLEAQNKTSLKAGDEIIVQVAREAVKTKAPVLTGKLSFTGKYCVITTGNHTIGFSNKITNISWKNSMREILRDYQGDDYGIIVRTNGNEADSAVLLEELNRLKDIYHQVLKEAPYRSCYSVLYKAPSVFFASIRDTYSEDLEEIITDDQQIYQEMSAYLSEFQPEDLNKLQLYQDPLLPLNKLYSLETAIEGALHKKVWLKSGGYLVIEPTEALVVIDVNTGKYSGNKSVQETILKINLEAAEEIGRQLILRNLSGIIIIDFIDLERQEDKDRLMDFLEDCLSKDSVKTTVVGMSKLNLVEVTRKKIRKPLHEQLGKDWDEVR